MEDLKLSAAACDLRAVVKDNLAAPEAEAVAARTERAVLDGACGASTTGEPQEEPQVACPASPSLDGLRRGVRGDGHSALLELRAHGLVGARASGSGRAASRASGGDTGSGVASRAGVEELRARQASCLRWAEQQERHHDEFREGVTTSIANLELENSQVRRSEAEIRVSVADLQRQVAELRQAGNGLHETGQVQMEQIRWFSQRVEDLELANLDARMQCADLNSHNGELQQQLCSWVDRANCLQSELESMETSSSQVVHGLQVDNATLKAQVISLSEANESLASELAALRRRAGELLQQNCDLQQHNCDLQRHNCELQQQVESKEEVQQDASPPGCLDRQTAETFRMLVKAGQAENSELKRLNALLMQQVQHLSGEAFSGASASASASARSSRRRRASTGSSETMRAAVEEAGRAPSKS
eukprot:TRINITY_DN14696_c1_g2_i2.p1 TRINITY_DN14696_c1_g2~~TRINITY_DN14696_c1_g2_i2.p1  ORF type:complete len:420 (-),score=123.86 TRINITY_DN14696_c1_g2_i2:159-1418(-)